MLPPRQVAALFVDPLGPYFNLEGVDPWPRERDARTYPGPDPVVCHPPCGPWSRCRDLCRYQDPQLAVLAVELVRRWGGVLEHPAGSQLWDAVDLPLPGLFPDRIGGRTMFLEQSRFGHPAPKPTWIYLVGARTVPPLPPARAPTTTVDRLCRSRRARTPPDFARWLVSVARSTAVA